jgi:prefoldin subunit 5
MAKKEEEVDIPNLTVSDIIEGRSERGIPIAKFIDDVGAFSDSFDPPAPAELIIGAYTDLHGQYKYFESNFIQKQRHLTEKLPDLDRSLKLIQTLIKNKEAGEGNVVRYNLVDNVFAKAELDYEPGTVNLWLGANVMLEFTFEEAVDFLAKNQERAKKELSDLTEDIGLVRDQIVTSEVNMSRVYNFDVRRKRTK